MPESDAVPEPRNIVNAFSPTADHLTIQLAIRRWLADGQNCELGPAAQSETRYVGESHELNDENTGRYEKPVQLGTQEYSTDGRECGR